MNRISFATAWRSRCRCKNIQFSHINLNENHFQQEEEGNLSSTQDLSIPFHKCLAISAQIASAYAQDLVKLSEYWKALAQGFGAGAGVNYVGDRFANPDNTVILPSYVTADAMAYYRTITAKPTRCPRRRVRASLIPPDIYTGGAGSGKPNAAISRTADYFASIKGGRHLGSRRIAGSARFDRTWPWSWRSRTGCYCPTRSPAVSSYRQ